jgi:hypothetical protein
MLGTDVKPYLQTIVLPLIQHTEFERVEQVLNVNFLGKLILYIDHKLLDYKSPSLNDRSADYLLPSSIHEVQ